MPSPLGRRAFERFVQRRRPLRGSGLPKARSPIFLQATVLMQSGCRLESLDAAP
jgi:hypothetical protein